MFARQTLRYLKNIDVFGARVLVRLLSVVPSVEGRNEELDIKPFSQIPGPSGLYTVPYIGTALHFKPFSKYSANELGDLLNELRKKFGDIMQIRLGKDNYVIVSHPRIARTVLQMSFEKNQRPILDIFEVFYHRNPKIPRNLGTLVGEEWAALRKPTQEKMMRPAVVKSYIPLIEDVTNDFIREFSKKETVDDLLNELMRYTSESVGMLCFNRRLGFLADKNVNDLNENVKTFFSTLGLSVVMPVKTYCYFQTKLYRDFENATLFLHRIILHETETQVQSLKKLEAEGRLEEHLQREPNFIYSLMSDPRMTHDRVIGTITSLFSGGIDSTANSLTFLLTHLAMNPDKQEKLFNEINDVVGKSIHLTSDHLSKLSYLKACVKESLRKTFPINLGVPRLMERDVVIEGYQIPKGTHVVTNMLSMSRDERFFQKPKEYVPERWLRSDISVDIAKGQEFPFANKPFGFGPRMCVGQRFAELEVYIATTKIIQNFKVSVPQGTEEPIPVYSTFTTPSEKITLYLQKRN